MQPTPSASSSDTGRNTAESDQFPSPDGYKDVTDTGRKKRLLKKRGNKKKKSISEGVGDTSQDGANNNSPSESPNNVETGIEKKSSRTAARKTTRKTRKTTRRTQMTSENTNKNAASSHGSDNVTDSKNMFPGAESAKLSAFYGIRNSDFVPHGWNHGIFPRDLAERFALERERSHSRGTDYGRRSRHVSSHGFFEKNGREEGSEFSARNSREEEEAEDALFASGNFAMQFCKLQPHEWLEWF